MKGIAVWYCSLVISLIVGSLNATVPGLLIKTKMLTVRPDSVQEWLWQGLIEQRTLIIVSSFLTYIVIVLFVGTLIAHLITIWASERMANRRILAQLFPEKKGLVDKNTLLKTLGIEESTLLHLTDVKKEGLTYQETARILRLVAKMENSGVSNVGFKIRE